MYRVDSSALSSAMDRIERWFAENVEPGYFAEGSTDGTGPLAALHARWDGQRGDVCFYDGFELLSVEECAAEQAMMDKLALEEDWPSTWWSTDWQPFGTDRSGQLLVVDVTTGEVLEFLHDDDARPSHAESLEAFLTTYAAQLESGERVLENGYIVDPIEQAEIEAKLEAMQQRRKDAQAEQERKSRPVLFALFAIILAIILIALWLR